MLTPLSLFQQFFDCAPCTVAVLERNRLRFQLANQLTLASGLDAIRDELREIAIKRINFFAVGVFGEDQSILAIQVVPDFFQCGNQERNLADLFASAFGIASGLNGFTDSRCDGFHLKNSREIPVI